MALYQKYRPKTLSEVVGQDFVRQTLQSALKNNQASHAYLFFGSRGTGKTSSARIMAKALNCQNPRETGDPCNECQFCLSADQGNFVDLIEIDGASNRKIEHARALIERINFSPTMGKRKVYIIDEVHMLTKEAFNALLKTIEEPPEHAYFLLATTELQKVPETIRSRCQVFTFHRFTAEQIVTRLQEIAEKEGVEVENKDALLLIAHRSAGGLRDAIGLFEQASASGRVSVEHLQRELGIVAVSQMEGFYSLLTSGDAGKAISFVGEISSEGLSLDDFLEQFLGLLREKMLHYSLEEDSPKTLQSVLNMIDTFDIARRSMRDTPIPTLPLEVAIITVTKIEPFQGASGKEDSGWHLFGKKSEKPAASEKVEEKQKPSSPSFGDLKNDEQNNPLPEKKEEYIRAKSDVFAVTEENIKSQWSKVVEKIDDAMLRAALKQSIVSLGQSGGGITLSFSAKSWKQQVEDPTRFAKLENAVQELFGPEATLSLVVQSVILQPVEKVATSDVPDEQPVTDPSVVSEIFGTK